jgi:hypothetical protein
MNATQEIRLNSNIKWFLISALAVIGAAGGTAAFAADDAWQTSMDKMQQFGTALETLVSAFAAVSVAPIGMAAAVKCFKHIALANM